MKIKGIIDKILGREKYIRKIERLQSNLQYVNKSRVVDKELLKTYENMITIRDNQIKTCKGLVANLEEQLKHTGTADLNLSTALVLITDLEEKLKRKENLFKILSEIARKYHPDTQVNFLWLASVISKHELEELKGA